MSNEMMKNREQYKPTKTVWLRSCVGAAGLKEQAVRQARAKSITAIKIISAPAARATIMPAGPVFSRRTNSVSAATQKRFITPTTNKTHISAQQQPRQWAPWRIPMCSAPSAPSRQCVTRNPSGLWQCIRQACFKGVNWYRPAAHKMTPPTYGLNAAIAGDSIPAWCSANWARVAHALKPTHTVI